MNSCGLPRLLLSILFGVDTDWQLHVCGHYSRLQSSYQPDVVGPDIADR